MGGLGVLDPYEKILSVDESKREAPGSPPLHVSDHVAVTSGWGGMGLHGNHSSTNLKRSTSGGSGIFFGEEQDDTESNMPQKIGSWSSKVAGGTPDGYLKTTHMANFYYSKSSSQGDLTIDGSENESSVNR